MSFTFLFSDTIKKQVCALDERSKRIIEQKIGQIKENPFKFKRIHSKRFNKAFRVRLNLRGKETRLVYVVLEPNVIIVCLLERKKDYRDLEKYLSKI